MASKNRLVPQTDEPPSEDSTMSGHPAESQDPAGVETPPAAPSSPSLREVTINGRRFMVDDDLAGAMAEREKQFDQKLSTSSAELGNLRKFYQEHQPQQPAQPKNYDTLLFEDPIGAVNRIKAELREEYQQNQRLESFWNRFYRANKDLDRDSDDFLVKAVLQQNIGNLAQLPEEDAAEKLADLSRRTILRYQGKQVNGEDSRARVEPASPPLRSVPRGVEDAGPDSITALLKARRAARQQKKVS